MHFGQLRWHFIDSGDVATHATASGVVSATEDLYSERIFGAKENFKCACGKLVGQDATDEICTVCLVRVQSDAKRARKLMLGYMKLAFHVPHPLEVKQYISVFPIAPIAYRIDDNNQPNIMGRKYENLVALNLSLKERSPDIKSRAYFEDWNNIDRSPLVNLLDDILGTKQGQLDPNAQTNSLLAVFTGALFRFDPDVYALGRACCIGLKFAGQL